MKWAIVKAVLGVGVSFGGISIDAATVLDGFNGGSLETTRWRVLDASGANLIVGGNRLNYVTEGSPTTDDFAVLELLPVRPRYTEHWEVWVDVANSANRSISSHFTGAGISVLGAENQDRYDEVFLELGNEHVSSMLFFSNFITDDQDEPLTDAVLNTGMNHGSIRMTYNGETKVFSLWVDSSGSANGFQWQRLASYGIAGTGGIRNTDWEMTSAGTFIVGLYGLSGGTQVSEGSVTFDNFGFAHRTDGRPSLSISVQENQVSLTWPNNSGAYSVEGYSESGVWETMAGPTVQQNGVFRMNLPLSAGTRFFRLNNRESL